MLCPYNPPVVVSITGILCIACLVACACSCGPENKRLYSRVYPYAHL